MTCLERTGDKNARSGRVDVHEAITQHARETLVEATEKAERLGLVVFHETTNCLFVQGSPVDALRIAVETASGYLTEVEVFD